MKNVKYLLLSLLLVFTSKALADTPLSLLRPNDITHRTPTLLARCVVGEASWSNVGDRVAIPWALTRNLHNIRENGRGRYSFDSHILKYCKSLHGPKKRLLRRLTFSNSFVPEGLRHGQRWSRVVYTLKRWFAGDAPSPCPKAEHWGGPLASTDMRNIKKNTKLGIWRRVRCTTRTANVFLKVNRKDK